METTKPQLPILKLADNVPVTIVLETQPEQAKELPNKFDETKPQHTYFVTATDPFINVTSKHVWFATDRQHKELIAKGVLLGNSYELVNRKMPGDKYAAFIIREVAASAEEDIPLPEEPQFNEELEDLFVPEKKAPINAVKAYKVEKVTAGMCYKLAHDEGLTGKEELLARTKELCAWFEELVA